VSSTTRRALVFAFLSCLIPVAGCLNGDVIVNTASGDMSIPPGPDDLSVIAMDMGPGCGLNTCASMNATCGPIGDGCGGVINCGTCPGHQTCGGGGTPFQCGGAAGCIPLTCASLGLACGPAGDGCGGTLDCGTCTGGKTCGGGGVNGQCGTQSTSSVDMAGGLCVPKTCAQMNANCGTIGDGCGNTINCGSTCPVGGDTCGGGGVPFQCGHPNCVPKTCGQLGFNCGPAGDGCGNLLNCGSTCPGSQTCGGGGQPGVCGGGCTAKTCGQLGFNCGTAGDGCGGMLNCGGTTSCTLPQTCGGGGTPNVCGAPACTPKTCAQLGYNCGAAGDGCGGLIAGGCGTCANGDVCGLQSPNQCGTTISGSSQCDGGSTTITGTVVAPTDCTKGFCPTGVTAGDPIYNATVFVPKDPITALTAGAVCDLCSMPTPALVQATTGIDGTFTLTNPPTGPGVKVVIQLGRWRRVLTLNVVPCTNNALTTAQTRLPRKQAEFDPNDNIPRFAISTGNVDVMECVLRKMGIDDSEFVDPNLNASGIPQAAGRVQIYQATPLTGGNGNPGSVISGSTLADSSLWGKQATINSYDAVLFPCTGGQDNKTKAAQDVVTNYANAGGRIFTTHYSYVWEYNTYNNTTNKVPWGCGKGCTTAGRTVGAWNPDTSYTAQFTGFVDQTFPKGSALAQWLQQAAVAASTTLGQIPVNVVRKDIDSISIGQQWLYSTDPPNVGPPQFPLHFTFNTDVTLPAAQQCGRVVYSDFHVENSGGSSGVTFPTECNGNSPLTPQEKLLEFMLFDLTSCVQPDVPTCTKKTCAQLGFNCGMQGDGCGGTQNCGMCSGGQVCGGGGTPGVCAGGCTMKTCAQLGFNCGVQTDGCGGMQNCGTCLTGTCGGGGTPGVCGGGGCTGLTCAAQGIMCGLAGDGCGNQINCGTCATGTCGGGGVPGQCGGGCTPLTCAQLGLSCGGMVGDGCGGIAKDGMGNPGCGMCTPPQTCGGGGTPGQCGAPPDGGVMCQPLTCAQQGLACGTAGDGCGNLLQCGNCPAGQTCGGGGTPGQCGAPNCTPTTCMQAGANCGIIGDGCGGTIDCGKCVAPQSCGGGGTPFQCGLLL
jgi:hypothetical protein